MESVDYDSRVYAMSSLLDYSQVTPARKLRRLENKKRKITAFLEISKINDEDRKNTNVDMKRRSSNEELEIHSSASHPKRMKHEGKASCSVDSGFPSSPSSSLGLGERCISVTRPSMSPDELAALRAQLRERQKAKMQKPLFYFTPVGNEAEFHGLANEVLSTPIFLQDIQHLLLCALLGDLAPYKPRWCKLLRWFKVSHVVTLVVEGASSQNFVDHKKELVRVSQLFDKVVEVIPPAKYSSSIPEELLCVAMSVTAQLKMEQRQKSSEVHDLANIQRSYHSCFRIQPPPPPQPPSNGLTTAKPLKPPPSGNKDMFPRLLLLLNPLVMLVENYPLPVKGRQEDKYRDYVFTKDVYEDVTTSSPLFAVDCEMCLTENNILEVARITIVDENLEVVLDTLVKPESPITNYLTSFSGITAPMLINVSTTLADVQQKIRTLLPADAILCGQSLNSDLHALKMMHPYVIDTSIIYNISGVRQKKPSLKLLSQMFLNTEIQSSSKGHCSAEDSMATMRLVQHKLQHSVEYGDVVMGGNNALPRSNPDSSSSPQVPGHLQNKTGLVTSFYSHIKDKNKTAALIGSAEALSQYSLEEVGFHNVGNVAHFVCAGNKEVAQHLKEQPINYNFTLAHMDLQRLEYEPDRQQSIFYKLDQRIAKTYKALAPNALFVVIFSGTTASEETRRKYHSGLCMVKVKS